MTQRVKAGTSRAEKAKRRALFVEAYIANGGNATQAAIAAGFSQKSARRRGTELATDRHISAEIERRRAEVIEQAQEKTALSKAWVLGNLRTVAERCLQAEPVLDRKGKPVYVETPEGDEAAAYIFNAVGANRSLELIGKEFGMFVDRKEIGEPGAFDKLDDDELSRAAAEADRIIAAARGPAGDDRKAGDRGRVQAPRAKA